MAFVQCKDGKEQEAYAEEHSPCFMSEDFRVYKTIRFSDDDSFWEIDADTMKALTDLHGTLMYATAEGLETSFTDLVTVAQDLKDTYLKTMEVLKINPVRKRKKQ